jgi:hypothetical protein
MSDYIRVNLDDDENKREYGLYGGKGNVNDNIENSLIAKDIPKNPSPDKKFIPGCRAWDFPDWYKEKIKKVEDMLLDGKLKDYVTYKGKRMLRGQAIYYSVLPDELFGKIPFPLNKKNFKKMVSMVSDVIKDDRDFMFYYSLLGDMSNTIATKVGVSWTADSLKIPDNIRKERDELIASLKDGKINAMEFEKELATLGDKMLKQMEKDGVVATSFATGGAAGSVRDFQHINISVGLALNSNQDVIDVITPSLIEGVSPKNFFNSSSEGIISQFRKAVLTAVPGELISRFRHITAGVHISKKHDCGSKQGLTLDWKEDYTDKMYGRYLMDGTNMKSKPKLEEGKKYTFRDPLYCRAEDGLCRVCVGDFFADRGVEDNLLLSSNAKAEYMTNKTLKAAHTGNSLSKKKVELKKYFDEL